MENKPVELKPCPFCGKMPKDFYDEDIDFVHLVECENPDCDLIKDPLDYDRWQSRPLEDILRKRLAVALDELNFLEPRVSEYLIDSIRRTYAEIWKINE